MVDSMDREEDADAESIVTVVQAGCAADTCPREGPFEFVTEIGGMRVVTRFCREHYDVATDPRVTQLAVLGDPRVIKDVVVDPRQVHDQ